MDKDRLPATSGPAKKTKYLGLYYQQRGDHWRFLDMTDDDSRSCKPMGIGPRFSSEKDLLTALDQFASMRGFERS